MQVILHQPYSCAPEGHTTLHFKAGDVLTGRAAEMALEAGAGFNPVEETKIEAKVETKLIKGGSIDKGGRNDDPSLILSRPPAPMPTRAQGRGRK